MELHRNAKLGLSGRCALVQARERGLSVREVARRFACRRRRSAAGPAAGARRASRSVARWPVCRSFEPSQADAAHVAAARAAADLCREAADRLGAAAAHRPHRASALDDLEGAGAQRALAAGTAGTRARAPLRVALPGRPPAHGRHASTGASNAPDTRSPAIALAPPPSDAPGSATTTPTRSSTTTPGLSSPSCSTTSGASTVTGFVDRALRAFAAHGIKPKRLMTDNAWSYTKNRTLRELLERGGIRHLTTKPHRPRTNGKVERFHQTMAREWAYGLRYRSSRHRAAALPHWLRYYNEHRPHSSLGGLPRSAAFTTSVGRTASRSLAGNGSRRGNR